jgi:hypothetical protein
VKSEHRYYLLAAILFAVAVGIVVVRGSIPVALVSFGFSIATGVTGRKTEQEIEEKQEIIDELLQDKSDLKEGLSNQRERSAKIREQLEVEREEKSDLREAKKRENQRLSNLKRALKRKGIDTEYLLDKYDESLYAPLMVLTHFSAPNNNTEEDAEYIKDNLRALDTKMLHGSARIVPPRNFDQSIRTKEELQEWFDDQILGDQTDLTHKLEVISVVDITQTFDRDASEAKDGPDFETHTISELFETDTVIPTADLLEILSRSDRISLEEELRENIALLVVQNASEEQMDQLLNVQTELEEELGDLPQIAQTDVDEIGEVFAKQGIDDAEELAVGVKEEAERLNAILNLD